MTLEKITWIIIRLIGLYLLFSLAEMLIGVLGMIIVAIQAGGGRQGIDVFLPILLKIFLYLFCGLYLVTDGSQVHQIINSYPGRQEDEGDSPTSIESA